MQDERRHRDLEDLSAWLDGELDQARAGEVERAVARDEQLARARQEMQALGRLLGHYDVPEPADDLAERVIARVRRSASQRPKVIRLARWLVPTAAAAAAAIVIAVVIGLSGPAEQPPRAQPTAQRPEPATELETTADVLAAATPAEREGMVEEFAIRKLDMLQDYEVVSNLDLLAEIEKLEGRGGGM